MSRKAGTPNKPKVVIGDMPKVMLDKNGNPDFGSCLTPSDKVEIPTGYKDDKFDILPPTGKDMLKETMPKYFILKSTDSKYLEEMVINAINSDCIPLGNVSVTNFRADNGSITYVYVQSMIRKE
jgi:hypothetical protein